MFSSEDREISKNAFFEEHLRTIAGELTLRSDCLELSFWRVTFKKPSCFSKIKVPVAYRPELSPKFGAYALFKFNTYAFFWT